MARRGLIGLRPTKARAMFVMAIVQQALNIPSQQTIRASGRRGRRLDVERAGGARASAPEPFRSQAGSVSRAAISGDRKPN